MTETHELDQTIRAPMRMAMPRLRDQQLFHRMTLALFCSRELHLFWKRRNLMISLLNLPTTWQRFVFSQEEHYNKIDKQRLDGYLEIEDHTMQRLPHASIPQHSPDIASFRLL